MDAAGLEQYENSEREENGKRETEYNEKEKSLPRNVLAKLLSHKLEVLVSSFYCIHPRIFQV